MTNLRSGLFLAALALGAACSSDKTTGPSAQTSVLTLGTALPVSGPGGESERYYTVEVPAGAEALRVSITGGTGDVDMAVRFGARPTAANFDCASFGPSNEEECIIAAPAAGTWHIVLVGFEAYTGALLRAELTTAPTATPLTSGVAVTGQSGAASSSRFFTITVPAGATSLTVATSGGSGDLDLYARFNAFPSTGVFDCESGGPDNDEICTIAGPTAGTWYVLLYGYGSYSGATLTATVTVP